jgi:hypothetical protein
MGDSGAGLFVLFVCNVLHVEVGFGNVMNKLDLSHIDALEYYHMTPVALLSVS